MRSQADRTIDSEAPDRWLGLDVQLWPIVLATVALAAIAVGITCMTCEFPSPGTLDWTDADAYRTGWGWLALDFLLALVGLLAVFWLQQIMARRVLFCVLLGLIAHVCLGIYLHFQFLAIMVRQQIALVDEQGPDRAELSVPDYHWQTLEHPEVRQDFQTPITTEKAELTERLEIEKRQPSDQPDLEPVRHEVEFKPEQREQVDPQKPELKPQDVQPQLRAETQRVNPARRATELQRPSPVQQQLQMSRLAPQESPRKSVQLQPDRSSVVRPQQAVPVGQLPPGERPELSRPSAVELLQQDRVLPSTELTRANPQLSSPVANESTGTIQRTLPSAKPYSGFTTPAHVAGSVTQSNPAASDAATTDGASASNPVVYEMSDSGTLPRREASGVQSSANELSSESTSGALNPISFADASAAAGTVRGPAVQRVENGSGVTLGGDTTGTGSPLSRSVGRLGSPGSLAQIAGLNDVAGGGGAADSGDPIGSPDGDSQQAFSHDIGKLAMTDGLGDSLIGRRGATVGWDPTIGSRGDIGTGSSGGESGTGAVDGVATPVRLGAARPRIGSSGIASIGPMGSGGPGGLGSVTMLPRRVAAPVGRGPLSPKISDVPGDAYWHRMPSIREDLAIKHGGTHETERAVERGLAYLARQQFSDGHWALDGFPDTTDPEYVDASPGEMNADTAASGLALLAFLGAGYTHQDGEWRSVVRRGLDRLIANQGEDGQLYSEQTDGNLYARSYGHGIASIALCEAYGMTRDPMLKKPAEEAVRFIVESQHPELGGWRYIPRTESDTSVSGWQLMALTSARLAGLDVPDETLNGVRHWLDISQQYEGARYAYNPHANDDPKQIHGRTANLPMTAEGLLMRMYLGWNRDDPKMVRGADYLLGNLPELGTESRPERDVYYWYLATQVIFQMQGSHWDRWNDRQRPLVLNDQLTQGPLAGSWDPNLPVTDKWTHAGGRHYLTTMHLLMLEVYYRYLPIYDMLDD